MKKISFNRLLAEAKLPWDKDKSYHGLWQLEAGNLVFYLRLWSDFHEYVVDDKTNDLNMNLTVSARGKNPYKYHYKEFVYVDIMRAQFYTVKSVEKQVFQICKALHLDHLFYEYFEEKRQ